VTDRCRAFIRQPKLSRRVPGYYTRRWFMMYRVMIDPAIGALLAGAFALLFIGAALQKLRSPERFAELFRAYRVVPDGVARLSWLVPVLELTTGAGLLAGGSRAGACAVGAALLLSYAAAMAINLQRGRRDLACGCGAPGERRSRSPTWRCGYCCSCCRRLCWRWCARWACSTSALHPPGR